MDKKIPTSKFLLTLNLLLKIGITEINIKPKKTINIPTIADEEIVSPKNKTPHKGIKKTALPLAKG